MKQHCNNRQKYRLHSEQNQTLLSDTIICLKGNRKDEKWWVLKKMYA